MPSRPDLLRDKLEYNFGNSSTIFVDVPCSALFFFCDLCCLNQELCYVCQQRKDTDDHGA